MVAFSAILIGGYSFYTLFVIWCRVREQETKLQPVVRVCKHNGKTVVTSDKVYLLSLRLREQLLAAFRPNDPSKIRVRPLIYAYRSTKMCDYGLTPEQLKAILDSCLVQNTEMDIPMGKDRPRCISISFPQMWRLLHGPDAKPPEFTPEVPEKSQAT